ncbi:MAG: alkaline phosphatase family protein [Trueperaceae bacterium]|nr:alkaline phosphatase family protein [Trueperaceae bacterium]
MVLYISIDGVRPDALEPSHAPTLTRLMQQGSYSLCARSVMPSITLPCHMSIFHSVPPERHNIMSNQYTPMVRPLPGLIEVLALAGKRSASFFSWEPLRDISRPLSLHHSSFSAYENDPEFADKRVLDKALPLISSAEFDFYFLYFGTADEVGHLSGWMSQPYLAQIRHIDSLIAEVLEHLPAQARVLIHSDHGGHDRMHGTDKDEDMLIPWILWGPGIKQGHELETTISLLDTAPTVAHLLGVSGHSLWEGRIIEEALI